MHTCLLFAVYRNGGNSKCQHNKLLHEQFSKSYIFKNQNGFFLKWLIWKTSTSAMFHLLYRISAKSMADLFLALLYLLVLNKRLGIALDLTIWDILMKHKNTGRPQRSAIHASESFSPQNCSIERFQRLWLLYGIWA